MNQHPLDSLVQYQRGPLHNRNTVITGLLLTEQLPQIGHYHFIPSSALYVSAHRQQHCILFSVGTQSTSAALMLSNLFIIMSVNVIGVGTDKQICDTRYCHVLGYRHLEKIAQISAKGAHEEEA